MNKLIYALIFSLALVATADAQVRVPVTHSQVAVATTSTAVTTTAALGLLILNNISDTVIYCNLAGGTATTSTLAIPIGGTAWFDISIPNAPVNCIHAGSGTKNLNVTVGR